MVRLTPVSERDRFTEGGKPNASIEDAMPAPSPLVDTDDQSSEPIEWDWDVEAEDRDRERQVDHDLQGAPIFQVERRVLKDVVREKMDCEAGRIKFLSAGEIEIRSLANH